MSPLEPNLNHHDNLNEGPPSQENSYLDRLKEVTRRGTALAIVGLELTPANEAIRFGAFAVAQAATKDPLISSAVLGATTFAVEAGGAVAAADLLGSPHGAKATDWINNRMEKSGIPKEAKVSPEIKAGVALLGGSAVVVGIKHREDPKRTIKDNLKYGVGSAGALGAVFTAEGYLAAEGLAHPSPQTIGAATIAIGGLIAAGRYFNNRFKRESHTFAINEYENIMNRISKGPQKQGIQNFDMEKVLDDGRTVFIDIPVLEHPWPLLTPISNNSEFLESFFEKDGKNLEDFYYLSLPDIDDISEQKVKQEILQKISELSAKDKKIVYEESSDRNISKFITDYAGENQEVIFDDFIDAKNSTSSAVIHYGGLTNVDMLNTGKPVNFREAYQEYLQSMGQKEGISNGTILLDQSKLAIQKDKDGTPMLAALWSIYERQFSKLVENHPSRQAQTFEEFSEMIKDPETLTVVHMTDGSPVSFGMFVGNIGACDWLNVDYYNEKFDNEKVLYFPGIATDPDRQGNQYSLNLIKLIVELIRRTGKNAQIVFQTTNISAGYIPKIVEYGAEHTGVAHIKTQELYRYNYRAASLREV